MDIVTGIQIQIDAFWYNLLQMVAALHWGVQRAFFVMGYTIELLNQWLVERAFAPLIAQTTASLSVALSAAFVVALLLLGLTYLLAVFVRWQVVEFRSALLWYLAGLLFFSAGPALYQGMDRFRRDIAQAFYISTLHGLSREMGSTFSALSSVDSSELGIFTPCDNLGGYLPTPGGSIDGLDVALAYLRADGIDVMGYYPGWFDPACPPHPPDRTTGRYTAGELPAEWTRPDSFFDNTLEGAFFPILTEEERAQSLAMAGSAQRRLLMAWPLLIFGICEQLVSLLLTIAQGLTFLSFAIAILFAFFKHTELIARSIVDLWIELIVQTIVIALLQSLVVTFFLLGTSTGSGVVVAGIGIICMVVMLIVLWSGLKAVWNSFNRLFSALGQAAGQTIVAPGTAAGTAARIAAGGAGLAAGGAASALAGLSAVNRGATRSQAAGIALGGSQALSDAARTLAYLPGVRGTALGDAAEQFTEGSIARQIGTHVPLLGAVAAPAVGALLLTDRHPDHAEYDALGQLVNRPMLVPAVGAGLERFTVPQEGDLARRPQRPPQFLEDEDGELLPLAAARPRRTGTFTPHDPLPFSDCAAYAAAEQGEEMEQHISAVVRGTRQHPANSGERDTATDLLAGSASALQQVAGQLQIQGSAQVAGVLGDVLRLSDEPQLDYLTLSQRMAQALNLTPLADGEPPVRADLAHFGLYLNQALRLGLAPQQAEQVVREVQASPDGQMTPATQQGLSEHLRASGQYGPAEAAQEVRWLQHTAQHLPRQITAIGLMPLPQTHVEERTVPPGGSQDD